MGGSRWSDDYYTTRAADRAAKNIDAFDHDAAIRSGTKAKKVHDKLNPFNVFRESRDSVAHPCSNSLLIVSDVTGSMRNVPRMLMDNLKNLHGLLTKKGYVSDPQLLFAAVGDAYSDEVPLQVGQFESGNEMEDDLSRIFLEGQGGGQTKESYELAMYFAYYKTIMDCYEKRGRKGYLFIIGDEMAYSEVNRSQVETLIGDKMEANLSTDNLVVKLQEKFHCFFIIPKMTSYFDSPWLIEYWKKLFGGENVLCLDKPEAVCECIATAVGLTEGTIDMDMAAANLAETGNALVVRSVLDAVAPLGGGSSLVKMTGNALTGGGGSSVSGTKRI